MEFKVIKSGIKHLQLTSENSVILLLQLMYLDFRICRYLCQKTNMFLRCRSSIWWASGEVNLWSEHTDQALISAVREFVCLQLWWAPAARHAWTHGLWFMRLLRGGWLWHCCQDPETGGWTIERQIGPLWGSGIWGPVAEWAHCVPSVRGPAAPRHKLRKWDGAMRAQVTVPLDLYDPCCSGSTNLWFCLLWIYKKTLESRMCYIFT